VDNKNKAQGLCFRLYPFFIPMKKVHLIAIGGSAMHNMALALHEKGFKVSGSDDEINEPSKSRLERSGLLPVKIGWFPEKLSSELDAVILGMHARADNPELLRAKELGLKIFSYPEYIYEATKDKLRIVIGGSHGKTTITAMLLHVFQKLNIETDFMVGAQLEGFNTMVRLSETARYAVIEGDEYLASPIDRRPKFHLYRPHIALLSGIAWDHINVFPTFENYVEQFRQFIRLIEVKGHLVYCENDPVLKALCRETIREDVSRIPYAVPEHRIENGVTSVKNENEQFSLQVFGDHNLMNLNGAMQVCKQIGISENQFLKAIQSFKGAAKRLELVYKTEDFNFYKDFAHSPSKLKATTDAVKKQFPKRKLVACMELHTFSSLTEEFLNEYNGAMDQADIAVVYYNPHTIAHKKLKAISVAQVQNAFKRADLLVMTESKAVTDYLRTIEWKDKVLLMMSSGNFDGVDFMELALSFSG
jgi:UDP-N-acetylmuramate: L-alanyl-gamma-D-glutamyl-meso-diaminopimelate ligase